MAQTLDTTGVIENKVATQNIDEKKYQKPGRRKNEFSKLNSQSGNKTTNNRPLPLPSITVTPSTPGMETPIQKPSILLTSLNSSNFTEWKTSTQQGTLIHFAPLDTASDDYSIKYSMHTPRNFLERVKRDHTLFLGSSIDGPELGFTRETPCSYLFTIGNPTVPGMKEQQSLYWHCENEMSKGDGREVKWVFKEDLSLYGMGQERVWTRTKGLGSGSGINEMELRDREGIVAAIWRREGSAFRGRLWIKKEDKRSEEEYRMRIARMRWEVAILLTWRLVVERSIAKGDMRPQW